MRASSDLPPPPEPKPVEPFNGPVQDSRTRAKANGALLYALGGADAVLEAIDFTDDAWDPSADEPTGGFDIHLGVYASD